MQPKPLLLIVEPDTLLAHNVSRSFEAQGIRTRHVECGRGALEGMLSSDPPDVVLLEPVLPDCAGTDVCRALRLDAATREIPIVFFSVRATELDRIVAFELGADDYIAKPCSVRELTLRVRALLRRQCRPGTAAPARVLRGESLWLDAAAHEVLVEGAEVVLTALEFRLLHTLMTRRGRVQTRSQLLQDVWSMHAEVTTRTVDTHMRRLRDKLGKAASYVETVRCVGYRFRPDGDAALAS